MLMGYGLRNFPQPISALKEVHRVAWQGGLVVSLGFFLPMNRLLRKLYLGCLYAQRALWGLLHGHPSLYTYIPDWLRSFVSIDDLSSLMRQVGFVPVHSRAFIFGGIGLHRGVKTACPPPALTV